MNNMRFRNVVHRQTLDDGLGRVFSIEVPVTVTDFWMDGQWEETINGEEHRKIEQAIEKAYPGWFHTCYKAPKQHCKACTRRRAQGLTKRNFMVT